MSFRPVLVFPPPTSPCTPRNHTSHAPCRRVGRNEGRRSSMREGMKAILQVGLGHRQMVPDIERRVAEIGEAERGDDVPDAQEPDLRTRLDHLSAARLADAPVLDAMAEVQRGRGPAAESDDVDREVAGRPRRAQMIVGFVEARQLAQPEHPAENLADSAEPRADPGDVDSRPCSSVGDRPDETGRRSCSWRANRRCLWLRSRCRRTHKAPSVFLTSCLDSFVDHKLSRAIYNDPVIRLPRRRHYRPDHDAKGPGLSENLQENRQPSSRSMTP